MQASIVGYIQVAIIAFVLGGELMLGAFGIPIPNALKSIFESKFIYAFLAFFVGAQIQASFLQTGAFEIYINGELAFSKLTSG